MLTWAEREERQIDADRAKLKSKGTGRRTLCTPQTTKALCKLMANACTIKTACEACGISETSFHEWIRRGEAGEQPFAQFAASVTRARGRGKAALVASIIDHPDWRAKLELLARVYPDEYGRTADRPINVDTNKDINVRIIYNTGGKTMEELLDFPSDTDSAKVAREKQERLLGLKSTEA